MSEKFIPEHIDPFRYAEQNLPMDGVVNVADMKRLSANLSSTDALVTVHFQFGVDEQGTAFLKGHLKTKLSLLCQRCMEPFGYEIISDFLLGIASTLDEVSALPEYYEPALTKEGQLALRELVEDELILNLPIIPRHVPEACPVKLPLSDAAWQAGEENNPFQALKALRREKQQKK